MTVFGVPVVPLVAVFAAGVVLAQPGAPTLSGGVGHDERERMMQRYRDYNLHLGFAEPDGSYLAGVGVTAQDENGRVVLTSVTDGPFLFASLPPGSYRVTVDLGGQLSTRTIRVGSDAGPIHYFRLSERAETAARPR
jgi:hypothetical protein